MNKKLFFVLIGIVLVSVIGYFSQPKKYNTIHEVSFPDGTIMSGYACNCFGFENKEAKDCYGVLYSCRYVK